MSKELKFGPEAREKLSEGIKTLADAVTSTLGRSEEHTSETPVTL